MIVGLTVGKYRTSLLLRNGNLKGRSYESSKASVRDGAAHNFGFLIPTLDPIWESSEYQDLSSPLDAGSSHFLQKSGSVFDTARYLSMWGFNLANVSDLEFDSLMQGELTGGSELSSIGSEEDTFEFVQFFSSQESIECS